MERGLQKVGYVTGHLKEGKSALDLIRDVLGESLKSRFWRPARWNTGAIAAGTGWSRR